MVNFINEIVGEWNEQNLLFSVMKTMIAGHVFLYLQAYKAALESLGHSEYALKAGFHLNPKAVEAALQVGSLLKKSVKNSGKLIRS